MLSELDAQQLAEWVAYWHLEPFGEQWRQTATGAYYAGAPHFGGEFSVDRIMPGNRPAPPVVKQTGKQLLNAFRAIQAVQAGKS